MGKIDEYRQAQKKLDRARVQYDGMGGRRIAAQVVRVSYDNSALLDAAQAVLAGDFQEELPTRAIALLAAEVEATQKEAVNEARALLLEVGLKDLAELDGLDGLDLTADTPCPHEVDLTLFTEASIPTKREHLLILAHVLDCVRCDDFVRSRLNESNPDGETA